MVVDASAGRTAHIPSKGRIFHQVAINFLDLFIQTCRKHRQQPVTLKYWGPNTAAVSGSSFGSEAELRNP